MFVLEMRADDLHAALGRLLDQVRLAGIPLAGVEAVAEDGDVTVRARLKTEDAEGVDRLVRRARSFVGVTETQATREPAFPRPYLAVGAA